MLMKSNVLIRPTRIRNFYAYIKTCGFIDLGYNSPAFTWSNKRYSTFPTFQRLDRCLANPEWRSQFTNASVHHIPMLYSDHAHILTIINPKPFKPKRPFKFENRRLQENDYNIIAKTSWNRHSDKPFHIKTKLLGKDLITWQKNKPFLKKQLEHIEKFVELHDKKQTNLEQSHLEITTKLATFHKQRVKKTWAIEGDRNTSFFHQAIMKRNRENRITQIQDNHGNLIKEPQDIAQVFENYFKSIFSSQLGNAGNLQAHNHQVTIQDEFTNSIPDEQEIYNIIKDVKKNAARGPDGLNVAFYHAPWPWIKNELVALVRDFYITGNIHPKLKDTCIVLIPKKSNPITPQDFRSLVFVM